MMQVLESAINWGTEETLGIQKILRPTGIVDGDFIPDIPTRLMERGEYNHVDLILGMTKDEGLLQSVQFELNQVRGKKSIYCVTVRAQTLVKSHQSRAPLPGPVRAGAAAVGAAGADVPVRAGGRVRQLARGQAAHRHPNQVLPRGQGAVEHQPRALPEPDRHDQVSVDT